MSNATYIIVNRKTREVWKSNSGKSSWNKPSHAKNAWVNHFSVNSAWSTRLLEEAGINPITETRGKGQCWEYEHATNYRFGDQDKYEVIELKETLRYGELKEAYAEGWKEAADWAERLDLIDDIDSPAYVKDRAKRIGV